MWIKDLDLESCSGVVVDVFVNISSGSNKQ